MRNCLRIGLLMMIGFWAAPAFGQQKLDSKSEPAKVELEQTKQFDVITALFQNHLTTITAIIAVAAGFLTLLQWREQRRENARETQRLERDKDFDKKLMTYTDAVIGYTNNSTGLVQQMKILLEFSKESLVALEMAKERNLATEAVQKAAEAARAQATAEAGELAKQVLDYSMFEDGFSSTLETIQIKIKDKLTHGNPDAASAEVAIVDGMYQCLLRREDETAIETWQNKALERLKKLTPETLETARLKARINFYIGLSQLKLGLYENAEKSFAEALKGCSTDVSYTLSSLEARVQRHGNKPLNDQEISKVQCDFEEMTPFLHKDTNPELGKMSPEYFRSTLMYWYGSFLIHVRGDQESLKKAEALLSEYLNTDANRTAPLFGLQCALKIAQKKLKITDLDQYARHCNIARDTTDPLEKFSVMMRQARYLGRRAILKEMQGDTPGMQADAGDLRDWVQKMRNWLRSFRKEHKNARIYSPTSRRYEQPMTIEGQLDKNFTLDWFRTELANNDG